MGIYINPKEMSKEDWLRAKGTAIPRPQDTSAAYMEAQKEGRLVIVLVDNGAFTAAGVAYNLRELQAFHEPCGRYKEYWTAKIEDLDTVVTGLSKDGTLAQLVTKLEEVDTRPGLVAKE